MPSPSVEFSIGLVVNPIAGLGGAVGLKGSDDPHIQELALQKGATPKSGERVTEMLAALRERIRDRNVRFLTVAGPMGETWLEAQGCAYDVCFHPTIGHATTADDTRRQFARSAVVALICWCSLAAMAQRETCWTRPSSLRLFWVSLAA